MFELPKAMCESLFESSSCLDRFFKSSFFFMDLRDDGWMRRVESCGKSGSFFFPSFIFFSAYLSHFIYKTCCTPLLYIGSRRLSTFFFLSMPREAFRMSNGVGGWGGGGDRLISMQHIVTFL